MAKAKKGLLFSILSLLITIAVTATSTYAWFMVNTTVQAQNMQVGVKSDTTYLVISSSSTLGTDTELDLQVTGQNATIPAVLPVKYDQTGTAQGTWKKAAGTSYTNGAASTAGYSAIAGGSESNYMVHFQFYIGATSTTAVAPTNLKVSGITVANNASSDPDNTFLPAVSVLLVSGSVYANYTVGNDATKTNGLNDLTQANCESVATLLASMTPGTGNLIDAYVYINGDNPVVTSANAANLGEFKVTISFTCTEGVAA